MSDALFVPEDFAVPDGLMAGEFRLEPLGPQHNEADYAAWTASIDHIRATPGFRERKWPHEMSLADNLGDLSGTRKTSPAAAGSPTPCSPPAPGTSSAACTSTRPAAMRPAAIGRRTGGRRHASVRSWVRADRAALDPVLHDEVLAWLERDWPFDSI